MGQQALKREADNLAENSLEDVNDPKLPEVVAACEFLRWQNTSSHRPSNKLWQSA
jgi:hypothetical protein